MERLELSYVAGSGEFCNKWWLLEVCCSKKNSYFSSKQRNLDCEEPEAFQLDSFIRGYVSRWSNGCILYGIRLYRKWVHSACFLSENVVCSGARWQPCGTLIVPLAALVVLTSTTLTIVVILFRPKGHSGIIAPARSATALVGSVCIFMGHFCVSCDFLLSRELPSAVILWVGREEMDRNPFCKALGCLSMIFCAIISRVHGLWDTFWLSLSGIRILGVFWPSTYFLELRKAPTCYFRVLSCSHVLECSTGVKCLFPWCWKVVFLVFYVSSIFCILLVPVKNFLIF